MERSPKIEKGIIERFKAGDEKAFSEIVLAYQKRVFNIALRMLGHREEARELSQEVFLSVLKSVKELREEVHFEPWLIQVTLNHCRNRWKYLKRRQYFNTDSLNDPMDTEDGVFEKEVFDPSENPETHFEKKMVRQWVQRGLMKLKEDQREIIILRDLQGYSYEEIGRLYSLPEGTIKSRLHRARMDLKEILRKSMH